MADRTTDYLQSHQDMMAGADNWLQPNKTVMRDYLPITQHRSISDQPFGVNHYGMVKGDMYLSNIYKNRGAANHDSNMGESFDGEPRKISKASADIARSMMTRTQVAGHNGQLVDQVDTQVMGGKSYGGGGVVRVGREQSYGPTPAMPTMIETQNARGARALRDSQGAVGISRNAPENTMQRSRTQSEETPWATSRESATNRTSQGDSKSAGASIAMQMMQERKYRGVTPDAHGDMRRGARMMVGSKSTPHMMRIQEEESMADITRRTPVHGGAAPPTSVFGAQAANYVAQSQELFDGHPTIVYRPGARAEDVVDATARRAVNYDMQGMGLADDLNPHHSHATKHGRAPRHDSMLDHDESDMSDVDSMMRSSTRRSRKGGANLRTATVAY
jgi:hypothetical protein